MSNLNNVYAVCPGLMSDGRGQNTDYKSHNEILKQMKGDITNSYDFRVKLQGSGLRDMAENIRYNMCSEIPAGDIKLNPQINLNIEKSGSFLDAFGPLSSNSFFGKPVPKVQVLRPELTKPATKLPNYSPYSLAKSTMTTMAPTTTTTTTTTMAPTTTTMAPTEMQTTITTMAPTEMQTTMATMAPTEMQTTMATMAPTMAPTEMVPTTVSA